MTENKIDHVVVIHEWTKELREKERNALKCMMMGNYMHQLSTKDKEAEKALLEIKQGLKRQFVYLQLECQALNACVKEMEKQQEEKIKQVFKKKEDVESDEAQSGSSSPENHFTELETDVSPSSSEGGHCHDKSY